jgi:hypothetical protein
MSVPIDRQVGYKRDTAAGGSDFDAVTTNNAGVVPAPDTWIPVKGGTFNKNIVRNERTDEILGYPGARSPLPWTARPELTLPCSGYFDVVARAIQQAFGSNPVRTGAAPAALTDTLKPLPLRSVVEAPRFHFQIVRDSLTYRSSGCVLNSFNLDIPADDAASIELGVMGLFYQQRPSSEDPGTPSFTLPVTELRLAQVSAYIDGSLTKVPDVIGCGLQFTQNYDPKFFAGRNLVVDPANPCQFVHFPAEMKRKASRQVVPRLTLGETSEVEEFKQDFSRAEKVVIEIAECAIATTPPAVRMIRITTPATVWTDGGAGALSKDDDITSPFTGTGGYDPVSGYDVMVEVVHNTPTLFSA